MMSMNTQKNESDHHHEYDPHTWLSPKMAIKEVKIIEAQLKKLLS